MNINRDNYEVWLIDYLDGNLNAEAIAELHAFLLLNPDIAEEFNGMSQMPNVFSAPDDVVFSDKIALKKSDENINDELNLLLAKDIESDLNPVEKARLQDLVGQSALLLKHKQAMQKTRLTPPVLSFDAKESLIQDQWPKGLEDDHLIISIIEQDASIEEKLQFEARSKADLAFRNRYEFLNKIKLEQQNISYAYKTELSYGDQPDFNQKNILLAAYAEDDLSGSDLLKAESLVNSDQEAAHLYQLIKSAKVIAPTHIVFDNKSALYKNGAVVIPLRRYFAFAGGVAAAIAALMWFSYVRTGSESEFAGNSKPKVNIAPEQQGVATQTISEKKDSIVDPVNLENISHKSVPEGDMAQTPEKSTPEFESPGAVIKQDENILVAEQRLIPQPIKGHEGVLPQIHHSPAISFNNPDMELVYEPVSHEDVVRPQQNGENLFDLLGKAAADKFENTFAYSLAERQITRLENVKKETKDLAFVESEDRMRIKLGPISIDRERNNTKEERNRHGIAGLVERLVDKATGEK